MNAKVTASFWTENKRVITRETIAHETSCLVPITLYFKIVHDSKLSTILEECRTNMTTSTWSAVFQVLGCCPRRQDLVLVCQRIVNWQRVSGFELLLTYDACVGEVQVHFSVALHLCSVGHGLSTRLTLILQWSTIFYSCYHRLQQRIQV